MSREGVGPTWRDLGLAVFAAGLALVLSLLGWLAPLDRSIGDNLLRLTHRSPTDVPVAVLAIDDDSITTLGTLPWPRDLLAEVVTAARRSGAAAVCLDTLLIDDGDADGDRKLEQALDQGPSILAAALDPSGTWLLPSPRFGGSRRAAHIHAEIGPDGVARFLAVTKQAGQLSLPALSLSAARVLQPEIPIEPGALLRPDFRPAPDAILTIPVVEFLEAPGAHPLVADRLVFIGITATGAGDRLIVPTHPGPAPSPGVLVHASATASILRDALIHPPARGWLLMAIFLSALAPQLLRTRIGAFRPWAVVLMAILIFAAAVSVLELRHLLVPAALLVTAMVLSTAVREGAESTAAQRESGRVLETLLRHHHPNRQPSVPRSSAARLTALRELQTAVLRDDAARQTLLEGMHDGVVMWDSRGTTLVVNGAASSLWGKKPSRADFDNVDSGDDEIRMSVIDRGGRWIAVSIFAVGDGGMAILRNITAERELEHKRRDMQRLVSHELKTPLSSIAGFGETLQRYELSPEEQQRVATLIRGEALRLGEMVATFLDLERLSAGQLAESTERVDLGELVARRIEILTASADARRQSMATDLEPGAFIRGSVVLLERVVDNLIGNAAKYSVEGDTIEIGVRRDGSTTVLTVTDHGPGIPEESIPRLFERFYRVPGVGGAGSGLGLALASEVAGWHGGCMEVRSVMGKGSTFTVRLPTEG